MKKKNARQENTKPSALQNRADINNTDAEAQRLRLLTALRDGGITTPDARARLNIMSPAARIKELRERGHVIHTIRERLYDDYGRAHNRVARYLLASATG
jgi:hypothetical protein